MRMALFLNDSQVRREVAAGNEDVLTIVGFALFPSLFTDDVRCYAHTTIKDAFVYEVKQTKRAYLLFLDEIARIALAFLRTTGRTPEVLEPLEAETPAAAGAGRELPCRAH